MTQSVKLSYIGYISAGGIHVLYILEQTVIINKNFILVLDYPIFCIYIIFNKGRNMTDISKYKNVSLKHVTYNKLKSLSGSIVPGTELSISKTVEVIVNEKAKKLNGKTQRSSSK
jgi:hypothetical protein